MKKRHDPYHRDLQAEDVEAVMSNEVYRNILAHCIDTAKSVKQISDDADIPLASAYRQVNALCRMDVLVVERSAITPEGKAYDLFRSRLREATLRLGPNGTQVVWQPNLPIEDKLLHMWDQLRRS